MLLVANNLPEMSSLAYPIACQLDIVDVNHKKVVKRLQLPNGSTDVKALATDSKGDYAYAVHLLARYQLPTNQVDRGWMSTNVFIYHQPAFTGSGKYCSAGYSPERSLKSLECRCFTGRQQNMGDNFRYP